MSEVLNPCPFCGKSDTEIEGVSESGSVSFFRCQNCGASTAADGCLTAAREHWNTRTACAEIAALKKEVEETRWDVLSWGQKYERVLVELVGVKKERDALKKEMGEERNHYSDLERIAGEQVAALREDVKLWKEKETAHYCDYAAAIGERDALRKENEALKKENAKLDSAWKATAILLGRRSFHDKYPTQMNEDESAKWTDDGSAVQGLGK